VCGLMCFRVILHHLLSFLLS